MDYVISAVNSSTVDTKKSTHGSVSRNESNFFGISFLHAMGKLIFLKKVLHEKVFLSYISYVIQT